MLTIFKQLIIISDVFKVYILLRKKILFKRHFLISDFFNYQLDFRIPLIYPDFTSFKYTIREKFENLWNVFLFIV